MLEFVVLCQKREEVECSDLLYLGVRKVELDDATALASPDGGFGDLSRH